MEGNIVKTHNFEASKNKIRAFSRQAPPTPQLKKVDISGGLFGWGDHKVTGYELNSLTTQIQDYFIDFNSLHIKLVKEFGEVYNALEALDKDYIQAILISIKAAEKANDDVKVAQKDIDQTIEVQKKTINVLSQFKKKIESYKHLVDIDKLWNDLQKSQEYVATISNNISSATKIIEDNSQEIEGLNKFKNEIEKIKHLKNVDELWCNSVYLKKEITALGEKINNTYKWIETLSQTLDDLTVFKNEFEGYKHIKDIDKLWSKSVKTEKDIELINKNILDVSASAKNQIQSIEDLNKFNSTLKEYEHLKDIDTLWDKCSKFETDITSSRKIAIQNEEQIDDLINSLKDIRNQNDARDRRFSKKLKMAYALAGGSIVIAIAEFAFFMLRVL